MRFKNIETRINIKLAKTFVSSLINASIKSLNISASKSLKANCSTLMREGGKFRTPFLPYQCMLKISNL